MKISLRIVFVVIIIALLAKPIFAGGYDFRKTRWGMSMEQVKASESLKVAQTEKNMLAYRTNIIGKNVFIIYYFVHNKLFQARYALLDSHTNKNDFITDYNDFKKILTRKYGIPDQDRTIWRNDLYKNDPSNWGMAVIVGNLVYISNWQTHDTEITCLLGGDNFKATCGVEYKSKKLEQLERKAAEKNAISNF